MADFGTAYVRETDTKPVSGYSPTEIPTPFGVVSLQAIPDTDYAFLAGMTGAQIAAAMGSDYEPPTTVPAPSGSLNTKQVVGIIGQQIAAALNQ